MVTPSNVLSRRTFVGAALGTAVLGLGQTLRAAADVPPATYERLVADPVFYVAHRGGGLDWPEMTRYAYQHAARLPALKALEISVWLSADNVLVCHHDENTLATTGVDYNIPEETWGTLSGLWVSADKTVNPDQPSRKLSRFDDVVDLFMDNYVLFVEPKHSAAAAPLMKRMVDLGQPERVVWKQPINSSRFVTAKAHGFSTWGYVLDEPDHLGSNLTRYAASDAVDMLGAPRSESDDFVTAIVKAAAANGKRTMMWEIRSLTDQARARRLGCRGMMTSGVTEVVGAL
jgi:glycerophosphoryl diester phosphodiesterase